MDEDGGPLGTEALLRETRWLRRLACGLVGPEAADDVVQSTWLAAIEHPPRTPQGVRAWLRRVATNFALRGRWREHRRATVERGGARPEALPSTVELVGQISLQRRVVDEVLALDEPYRATVILVFFHDLSAAEVARRLGVPSSTVRTRLNRALDRLRERLERTDPDWRPALAGFAGIGHLVAKGATTTAAAAAAGASSATVASGVMLMTAKIKILTCAALAVAAGLVVWQWQLRSEPPPEEPASVPVIRSAARSGEPLPEAAASRKTANSASQPIVASRFVETESAPASAPAQLGSVLVKLVWAADKTPAAGVPFKLIAWGRQDPFLNQLWLRSDDNGSARVEGMRPGSISAVPIWEGRADGKIEAGKELELKVEIPPGPAVEGIVVDAADRPVEGASIWCGDLGGVADGQIVATTGPGGTFRLPSTQSDMWVVIGARAEGRLPSPFAILTGKAGATLHTRLVLGDKGVELAGKVTDAGGAAVPGAIVQVGDGSDRQFTQRDGSQAIEAVTFRTKTDADGAFRFTTRPGKTPLFVRAEKLAPWRNDVEVGEAGLRGVPVVLQRGATIAGKVLDAAGAPLRGVEVTAGERHWTIEGFQGRTKADGTFRLEGVTVGDILVTADADEKGKASTTLHTVSGEVTEWIAKLSTGAEIKGRVVDERGAALAKCFIEVVSVGNTEFDSKFANADKDGRFTVTNCAQARYVIDVRDPAGGSSSIARIADVAPGGPEILIQVADDARATGWLAGVVLGPDGRPIPAQVSPWRQGDNGSPIYSPDPKTGAFKLGPLPPGDYRLTVRAEGLPHWRKDSLRIERDKTLDVGTIRLESGGALVVLLSREGGGDIGEPWLYTTASVDKSTSHLNLAGTEARSGPLSAGKHRLSVSGKGLASQELPFEIRAGETTEMKVTLLLGVPVVLHFDDPPGVTESKRVRITVRDESGAVVFTRETERYPRHPVLEVTVGLRPGTYRVEAIADDTGRRCAAEITVPLPAGGERATFGLKSAGGLGAPGLARHPADVVRRN